MERLTSRHKNVHHDESSSKLEERASRYSFSNVDGDEAEFEKQLRSLYAAEGMSQKGSHDKIVLALEHYKGNKQKLLIEIGIKYALTIAIDGDNVVDDGVPSKKKEKVQAEFGGDDDDDDDDDVDALYSMDAPIVGIDKHYAEKTHEKHHMVRSAVDEAYLGGKTSDDLARSEDDGPRFELRTIEDEDELGQERGKKKARMDGRQGSGAVNLLGHHYVLAGHKHTDEEGNVISKERDGKQIERDWRKADDHEGVQVERPKNEVAILFFLTLPCTLAYLCLCVEPCKLCSPKVKIGADGK